MDIHPILKFIFRIEVVVVVAVWNGNRKWITFDL